MDESIEPSLCILCEHTGLEVIVLSVRPAPAMEVKENVLLAEVRKHRTTNVYGVPIIVLLRICTYWCCRARFVAWNHASTAEVYFLRAACRLQAIYGTYKDKRIKPKPSNGDHSI